jgi:hypothetical protein
MKDLGITALLLVAGLGLAHAGPNGTPGADQVASPPAAAATEEEQLVCKRERKAGSNRIERVCMTASQAREAKERARTQLDQWGHCSGNNSICGGRQTN